MKIQPFTLERFFARHEFSAPYSLCSSDCESWTVRDVLDLAPGSTEELMELRLGYTESPGASALRQAIASLYEHIRPEQVLVFTGAEEAIFCYMNCLLEPGDDIVAATPCYQSLSEVARAIGATVIDWPVRQELDWTPDPEQLAYLITPKTKAVVVNFPHNPTGGLPDKDAFAAMLETCRRRGVMFFCDEVYRYLELDSEDRLDSACDVYEHAVSLGVMSKSYGLPGLRLGWAATRNEHIVEQMASFKDYTTICNPAPSEVLARIALQHKGPLLARNREICAANLDLLEDFFARREEQFGWVRPRSGPVCFPWLREGDAAKFCLNVLQGCGVLLAPGSHFGLSGPYFRIGFGRRNMAEALGKLEEYLDSEGG